MCIASSLDVGEDKFHGSKQQFERVAHANSEIHHAGGARMSAVARTDLRMYTTCTPKWYHTKKKIDMLVAMFPFSMIHKPDWENHKHDVECFMPTTGCCVHRDKTTRSF